MAPCGSGIWPTGTSRGAIQIVDLYHARQHLWELSGKLFPNAGKDRKHWFARPLGRL